MSLLPLAFLYYLTPITSSLHFVIGVARGTLIMCDGHFCEVVSYAYACAACSPSLLVDKMLR